MEKFVWVIYEKDGYGGQTVEKVFGSEKLAINWIVEKRMIGHRGYFGKKFAELEELAKEYIEKHELSI